MSGNSGAVIASATDAPTTSVARLIACVFQSMRPNQNAERAPTLGSTGECAILASFCYVRGVACASVREYPDLRGMTAAPTEGEVFRFVLPGRLEYRDAARAFLAYVCDQLAKKNTLPEDVGHRVISAFVEAFNN